MQAASETCSDGDGDPQVHRRNSEYASHSPPIIAPPPPTKLIPGCSNTVYRSDQWSLLCPVVECKYHPN